MEGGRWRAGLKQICWLYWSDISYKCHPGRLTVWQILNFIAMRNHQARADQGQDVSGGDHIRVAHVHVGVFLEHWYCNKHCKNPDLLHLKIVVCIFYLINVSLYIRIVAVDLWIPLSTLHGRSLCLFSCTGKGSVECWSSPLQLKTDFFLQCGARTCCLLKGWCFPWCLYGHTLSDGKSDKVWNNFE